MNVAEKIRLIVEERGVKYTAISQATSIPVDAVSKSFLGKRKLLADEMLAICNFLHLDLSDLIDPATA
jgi:DNA-binding Xre family transcriptional regulator